MLLSPTQKCYPWRLYWCGCGLYNRVCGNTKKFQMWLLPPLIWLRELPWQYAGGRFSSHYHAIGNLHDGCMLLMVVEERIACCCYHNSWFPFKILIAFSFKTPVALLFRVLVILSFKNLVVLLLKKIYGILSFENLVAFLKKYSALSLKEPVAFYLKQNLALPNFKKLDQCKSILKRCGTGWGICLEAKWVNKPPSMSFLKARLKGIPSRENCLVGLCTKEIVVYGA